MASTITIRIFRNRLDELLEGRTGPVVLHQANEGRRAEGVARRLAPRDTGELAGSIGSRLTRASRGRGFDVELFASAPYAVHVIRGSVAHWPPIDAVAGWAQRHGFPERGGAFLVARAISRRNKPPNNFLVKACREVGLDAREVR